jgi:leucine rich repeat (LRR) protein
VTLHLLHRAGIPLEHLPHMADFLWEKLNRAPRHWFWGTLQRPALRKGAVARDARTPPEVLARLAEDAEVEVRGGVARNPSTPPEVLARLAQVVRSAPRVVAGNPSAPPEVLARLAQDAEARVRQVMVWNASALLEDL